MPELANEPGKARTRLRLNNFLSSFHNVHQQLIIFVGILTKNVHDDCNSFLERRITWRVNNVFDKGDSFLACSVHWEDNVANASDGPSHAIYIEVSSILLQLRENELNITDIGHSFQDLYLLQLYVNWVRVFNEENLDVLIEDGWPLIQNKLNVSESYVLDLMRSGEQWDQGVR